MIRINNTSEHLDLVTLGIGDWVLFDAGLSVGSPDWKPFIVEQIHQSSAKPKVVTVSGDFVGYIPSMRELIAGQDDAYVRGIPITHETLALFGFSQSRTDSNAYQMFIPKQWPIWVEYHRKYWWSSKRTWMFYAYGKQGDRQQVRYIHELQNAYWRVHRRQLELQKGGAQ